MCKKTQKTVIKGFPIKGQDASELIGQVIDVFEDFLQAKGIYCDILGTDEDGEFGDDVSIIKGDYDWLAANLQETFTNWKVIA